jgi:RNase H-fold protein (predicted Holliday junction resolvase)
MLAYSASSIRQKIRVEKCLWDERAKTYAALGAIDEEIYTPRLRLITGCAKAIALIYGV